MTRYQRAVRTAARAADNILGYTPYVNPTAEAGSNKLGFCGILVTIVSLILGIRYRAGMLVNTGETRIAVEQSVSRIIPESRRFPIPAYWRHVWT